MLPKLYTVNTPLSSNSADSSLQPLNESWVRLVIPHFLRNCPALRRSPGPNGLVIRACSIVSGTTATITSKANTTFNALAPGPPPASMGTGSACPTRISAILLSEDSVASLLDTNVSVPAVFSCLDIASSFFTGSMSPVFPRTGTMMGVDFGTIGSTFAEGFSILRGALSTTGGECPSIARTFESFKIGAASLAHAGAVTPSEIASITSFSF
mmetsp:Transcript_3437/g.5096  ORF Transcript_3437/g.5096 Transcript_3437/m.5096 type:complete len:212 (+) Transcript_3437:4666-5301(+)